MAEVSIDEYKLSGQKLKQFSVSKCFNCYQFIPSQEKQVREQKAKVKYEEWLQQRVDQLSVKTKQQQKQEQVCRSQVCPGKIIDIIIDFVTWYTIN